MPRRMTLICAALLAMTLPAFAAGDGQDAEAALARADTYTVLIKTTVRYPFGDDTKGRSRGAGFVIDRDRGWILTNAHVASRSVATMTVSFHGGEPIRARRLYVDPFLDLAILAVPPATLPARTTEARLECEDSPRAGAPVVAYGHPEGHPFTGTKGIVSGVSSRYESEFLQTDAPINPGNSGGPLINLTSGRIVGINTASVPGSQNTNFALAARFACPIVELLRQGKDPSPPKTDWRFFTEADESVKVKVALPGRVGDSLGLKSGDTIVSVNGTARPTNETQILHALRGSLDALRIDVERDGRLVHLRGRVAPEAPILDRQALLVDGMIISEFDRRLSREVDFKGVLVESVDAGSEAEAADIPGATILVSVNGTQTPNLAVARTALSAAAQTKAPAVLVLKKIGGNVNSSRLFNWLERRMAIQGVKAIRAGEPDAAAD